MKMIKPTYIKLTLDNGYSDPWMIKIDLIDDVRRSYGNTIVRANNEDNRVKETVDEIYEMCKMKVLLPTGELGNG